MTDNYRSATLIAEPAGLVSPPESPTAWAAEVAAHFLVPPPLRALDFPGKGNIHQHTFLITAGPPGQEREYLLQRINQEVFTRPHAVMAAMLASIRAQRDALSRCPLPPGEEWEPVTLVSTGDGAHYLELADAHGTTVWRLMERILYARTYKSLSEVGDPRDRLNVAHEAGRGLARYGDLTCAMEISGLANPLPGYRDTRGYYNQFLAVCAGIRSDEDAQGYLPADRMVRESTWRHYLVHLPPGEFRRRMADPDLQRFLALAEEHASFALTLARARESGAIRTVAVHGDTKLDNFLFSTRTGRVKALVALDTIMPQTWLVDWGDMVRSLVNVAGEKEADLRRVSVDPEVFRALTHGFLSTAREVTPAEVALMVDAVQVIALELGVRFLTDYLRGDTYFSLGPADPPDLNKTRAMVQLTLFMRLREQEDALRACVETLAPR